MKSSSLVIAAVALALATTAQAQVKVGANPGTISTNAVLDVEGTSGSHSVILQSGNMGVGTVTPGAKVEVSGPGTSTFDASILLNNTATNGRKWTVGSRSDIISGTGKNGTFIIADESATSPRLVIDQAGYVGTGTTAPISHFSVVSDGGGSGAADDMEVSTFGAATSPGLIFKSATGTAASPGNLANGTLIGSLLFQGRYNGANGFLSAITSGYAGNGTTALSTMAFTASGVEQMRISETGSVGIGTTAPVSKLNVIGGGSNNFGVTVTNLGGGGIISNVGTGSYALDIQNNGTEVGRVTANASSTTYGTTSDVRLKENIKATHYSLADLMKIQVKDYNYKTDPKKEAQTGFLAQQLYTVFPNAVSVGGENAAKNPWNVDYGKVTPLLVKAVQELNAKVEALEKENSTLKAQTNDVASLRSELDAIKALVLKGGAAQKNTSVTKR